MILGAAGGGTLVTFAPGEDIFDVTMRAMSESAACVAIPGSPRE